MGTLAHYSFSDFTGIAKVEIVGTVSIDSNTAKFDTANVGTNAWDSNGCYQSTPIAIQIGHVIYGQIIMNDVVASSGYQAMFGLNPSSNIGIGDNRGLIFGDSFGTPFGVNGYIGGDGAFGSITDLVVATWYDLKIEIIASGFLRVSKRLSDSPGNFNPNSSSWGTAIGTSAIGVTAGNNYHMRFNSRDTGNQSIIHMDEWYWTDDGTLSQTASESFVGSRIPGNGFSKGASFGYVRMPTMLNLI